MSEWIARQFPCGQWSWGWSVAIVLIVGAVSIYVVIANMSDTRLRSEPAGKETK